MSAIWKKVMFFPRKWEMGRFSPERPILVPMRPRGATSTKQTNKVKITEVIRDEISAILTFFILFIIPNIDFFVKV